MSLARPQIRRWMESPDLDMLLLFAQSLEEMLFDYTIDSFKARALNLHSSLIELAFVVNWAKQGRVSLGALIPLLEELSDRIRLDPVLSTEERATFAVYLERLNNDRAKPEVVGRVVDAMLMEIGGFYWERLLGAIPEAVAQPKNSKVVRSLANSFVAEAELQGYHRSFVFHAARRYFWGQRIECPGTVKGFLDLFNGVGKQFTFVFRVSAEFSAMADVLEDFGASVSDTPPVLDAPSPAVRRFLQDGQYSHYCTIEGIEANDAIFARLRAEHRIQTIAGIYAFHVHHEKPDWSKACVAVEQGDTPRTLGLINPPVPPMKRHRRGGISDQETPVRRTLEVLRGLHFGTLGARTFFKALDYHRAAMEIAVPESQLISLWAALEGFLPPPEQDGNRISHYVGTLTPALTLTYAEKLFDYIASALIASGARDLIAPIQPDDSFLSATVCLLTAREHSIERAELYKLLARNPLLRWHCFSLHEQFKSTQHCSNTLKEHKQRVSWHIQRIYSSRNQIVHSAESLPYLDTLVENMHAYVDVLLHAVAIIGEQARVQGPINGALALMSVQEQLYFRELAAVDIVVTRDNYKTVLFGRTNPLSPFNERFTI